MLLLPPKCYPLGFLSLFLNTFSLNVPEIKNRFLKCFIYHLVKQGHFRDPSKYMSDQEHFFFLQENQVLTSQTGTICTISGGGRSCYYSAMCGNKSLTSFPFILDLKANLFLFNVFLLLILTIRENDNQNKFSVSSSLE